VALEPAEKQTQGGIWIPDASQDTGGSGYILAMGEDVGLGDGGYSPYWSNTDIPVLKLQESLVGRHIVFGKYSLKGIHMDTRDRDFQDNFGMIHAKDVWLFQNDESGWKIQPKEE